PIGFMAAVHVMATIPSVMFLEFHGSDLPFWSDLVAEEVIRDGKVALPDRPGLGVTLNMDLVRQYSRPGEPVFEEGPAN
ncbi:MAG: mandelate racemase/muconate lactonizing enzyme family protein, partial [Actinomycetota bacterium]|nr:mandelate racemase/muconate lactonizing enzyme family protein [Actinomycetota bacterium]